MPTGTPAPCEHDSKKRCEDCKRGIERLRARADRAKDPAKNALAVGKWRSKNREKLNREAREQRKLYPEAARRNMIFPEGVTIDSLWEKQKGLCALCYCDLNKVKKVVVDHCHTTRLVRGLLCNRCNTKLQDDRKILARIPSYLDCSPAQQILAQAREPVQLAFDFS